MAFSMFSSQACPIAIDFGSATVKLLQIADGNTPSLTAAAELAVPESARSDLRQYQAFCTENIPKALSQGGFKGKKVSVALPAAHSHVQHMQLANVAGASADDLIKGQLHAQLGCLPDSVVVRSLEVATVHRAGQALTEVICFAMPREIVMRYVSMLKAIKLTVVGVHTPAVAMLRAFDHLNRRDSDKDVTTVYVDLGWGSTQVAIAHGTQLVFSRCIQFGGRHFDQFIAKALHCDVATAREHRLALAEPLVSARKKSAASGGQTGAYLEAAAAAKNAQPAGASSTGAAVEEDRRVGLTPSTCHDVPSGATKKHAASVDMTELLDTIADELSMCLRYHRGLFPDRDIDRTILVGGEARQVWMCQHVVKTLRFPAQLGDPVSRLKRSGNKTPGVDFEQAQPGWAVTYGLCHAPTDL